MRRSLWSAFLRAAGDVGWWMKIPDRNGWSGCASGVFDGAMGLSLDVCERVRSEMGPVS
jgi:hypothetical protein